VQEGAEHGAYVVLERRHPVEPPVVDGHLVVRDEGPVERLHGDEEEGEEVGDRAERLRQADDPQRPGRLRAVVCESQRCTKREQEGWKSERTWKKKKIWMRRNEKPIVDALNGSPTATETNVSHRST